MKVGGSIVRAAAIPPLARELAWRIAVTFRAASSREERLAAIEAAVRATDTTAIEGEVFTFNAHALAGRHGPRFNTQVASMRGNQVRSAAIIRWGLREERRRDTVLRYIVVLDFHPNHGTLFAVGVITVRRSAAGQEQIDVSASSLALCASDGPNLDAYLAAGLAGKLFERVGVCWGAETKARRAVGRSPLDGVDLLQPDLWWGTSHSAQRTRLEGLVAARLDWTSERLSNELDALERLGADVIALPASVERPDWAPLWTPETVTPSAWSLWLTVEALPAGHRLVRAASE